jgi:hypothetical protein
MSDIAILRQLCRTHETRLVMVGDEMDTAGLGQAQVENEKGSRPALARIVSHRLSGFALFEGGSRLRQNLPAEEVNPVQQRKADAQTEDVGPTAEEI